MIHKTLIVIGVLIVFSWPYLYAQHEWYWWGLPVGFVIALSGVIASGGKHGGGT